MMIRGRLEAVGFAELAHLRRLSRRTGRLVLTRGPDRVELLLSQGALRATSYPAATEELAHLLVSRQIIRESVLQGLLHREQGLLNRDQDQKQSRGEPVLPFTHMLQRAAGIDDQRINDVISYLVEQAMSRFMCWTAGCFSFQTLSLIELDDALGQADLRAHELPDLPSAHSVEQLANKMPGTRLVSSELILRVVGHLAPLFEQGLLVIKEGEDLRAPAGIENHRVIPEPSQQLASCLPVWERHIVPLFTGSSHRCAELPGRLYGKPIAAAPLVVLGQVQAVICFPSAPRATPAAPSSLTMGLLSAVALSLELHLLQRRHFGASLLTRQDPPRSPRSWTW
jgi:hypothetical protein